jgi:DNA-binding transcriptional regulator GbsR (MarR family)
VKVLYFSKEVSIISNFTEKKLAYIEEMGQALGSFGLPKMAGRVYGALLVADPPEMSADALASVLKASRGSISTSTRMLELMGLVERLSKPGERRDYFRNRPGAWAASMQLRMKAMSLFLQLADKGLEIVDSDDPEVLEGLLDMKAFFTFMVTEFPKVLEKWDRAGGKEAEGIKQEGKE